MTTTEIANPEPRKLSREELRSEVVRARVELADTLNAIEDKLNVPRKLQRRTDRWSHELRRMRGENPLALAGIAVGAVAVIGGLVWGIVMVVTRD
jgi:hypothetical protein